MDLKIKGFQKISLIDYPGKVCSVIFLAGCNFRCPYCQNPDLIKKPNKIKDIAFERVLNYMIKKRKWIDGICITGGEPTIYNDLPAFIQKVKKKGFLIKLDTNGTNPDMLEHLIRNCLIDYVSMDIKSPLEKYDIAANTKVNKSAIRRSVELIKKSGLDYEFRTTVVPTLFKGKDALAIGEWLNGASKFFIQQFRPTVTLNKSYQKKQPYSEAELNELKEIMTPFFESVEIRT